MPTYLLEIGTEELPAAYLAEAEARLRQLVSDALSGANLAFESVSCMSTPRRLAVLVKGLADKQETTAKKIKGLPVEKSFDSDGKPTHEALKFAERNGVSVEQLDREEIKGVAYIVANLTIVGRKTEAVLTEIVPKAIGQLSGERLMRWGSSDFKFSRPIRWLVSLLDDKVVPFTLDNLTAARTTLGHRVLAPGSLEISHPDNYVKELEQRKVLVDPGARRSLIEQQVTERAKTLNGKAKLLNGPLLEEIVYITEWPHAVVGDFAQEYLDLPDALIETIMVHHQRYFPVEKSESGGAKTSGSINRKSLLPHFITIANNDRAEAQDTIKLGNERVLKARLADGRFFYFDDQKTKLSDRKGALAQLTFQRDLGNYADKSARLVKLSQSLSSALGLGAEYSVPLERTVELSKLDLVSNLVRELPELQGYVGAWYAELEGEAPVVVQAIASHYSPRSNDDAVPADTVGQFAALLDKVDNLVGLFALGKRPSGSSDPYALRRQAQGIIDILIDALPERAVNLSALIDENLALYQPFLKNNKKAPEAAKVKEELADFLMQRLRGKLLDRGLVREIVDAAVSVGDPLNNLADVLRRCLCIQKLIGSSGNMSLARAGVRVGNILKVETTGSLDDKLLELDAEKQLWQAFQSFKQSWQTAGPRQPASSADYAELAEKLSVLAKPIDDFFDNVMVNDEDQKKRQNRHALLRNLNDYFKMIGDFPKLQSLLN